MDLMSNSQIVHAEMKAVHKKSEISFTHQNLFKRTILRKAVASLRKKFSGTSEHADFEQAAHRGCARILGTYIQLRSQTCIQAYVSDGYLDFLFDSFEAKFPKALT